MTFAPFNLIATTTEYLTPGQIINLSFPFSVLDGKTRIRPRHALISVEGNAVRWGLNPTVTTGTVVSAGSQIDFTNPLNDFTYILQQMQFIALVNNATLQCQFFS